MAIEQNKTETYAEDTALTKLFGNGPKVKIIAALLSESDHDLNVSQIAELAGVHRSTVYDHLQDLVEVGVVEKTREVSGSQMYRINKDSTIAESVAQLEWDLLDVIVEKE